MRIINLYGFAARWSVLVISAWGALLGLFVQSSLVYRLYDEYDVVDIINYGTLAVAGLGLADVLWHDIGGRLIWPSLDPQIRHRVCVMVYSLLGAGWLLKSFAAALAADAIGGAWPMAVFAVCMASICGVTSVALALERR